MHFIKHVFHVHEWTPPMCAIGELPKENTPEPVRMNGHVTFCECGAKRFKADAKGLREVEVW